MKCALMPLAIAARGDRVRVVTIDTSRALQKRLSDLGILVGKELEVIQRLAEGRMVVAIGDTRLALGCEMTRRIGVTQIEHEAQP